MKAVGVRPTRGDFGLPDAVHHQAGRPVREHPVLPHGQVRPRSDAAHRLRTAGRGGPGPHRAMDRRDGRGAPKAGPGPGQRAARPVAGQPEVGAAAGAEARPRRAGRRRARRVAGRGREAPARPDPRPVRGLSAVGRAEGAEARLEPPAQGHPGPQGRPRPGGEAVLVAGDPVRQLPPDRRPGHAGRAGPVDHREAPFARGPAGEPPGAVAPDRAEVRHLCRRDGGRPSR